MLPGNTLRDGGSKTATVVERIFICKQVGQRPNDNASVWQLEEEFRAVRNNGIEPSREAAADGWNAAGTADRTACLITDQAGRVGEQAARAGVDIFRRSTKTARKALQLDLNAAARSLQRMTGQFTQAVGFGGPSSSSSL